MHIALKYSCLVFVLWINVSLEWGKMRLDSWISFSIWWGADP